MTHDVELAPGHWRILADGATWNVVGAASAEQAHAIHQAALAPPPASDDVIRERARRLSMGFDYDFGDARGIHRIGTTGSDMEGWDEVAKGALAAIALGQPEIQIDLVTDTGPVVVTALEWQGIVAAAMSWRQTIWHASFAIQAQSPIPTDFTDDTYWPTNS